MHHHKLNANRKRAVASAQVLKEGLAKALQLNQMLWLLRRSIFREGLVDAEHCDATRLDLLEHDLEIRLRR